MSQCREKTLTLHLSGTGTTWALPTPNRELDSLHPANMGQHLSYGFFFFRCNAPRAVTAEKPNAMAIAPAIMMVSMPTAVALV